MINVLMMSMIARIYLFSAFLGGFFYFADQNAFSDTLASIDSVPIKTKIHELSELCWKNREKNTNLAIKYGIKGLNLAEENGLVDKQAQLNDYLGVVYQHYKHEPEPAIIYFNKALQLSLQIKDSVQVAYVYNNLGDAFYLTGNVPLAVEYAEKSMDIFKKLNHRRGIAYGYVNLGLVSRISEKYDSALYYFDKAIEIRKGIKDSIGIASATLELARTLVEMNRPDSAMEYFRKSLMLHEKLDNKKYMAFTLQGMGDVYFNKANYDSAMINYQRALKLNRERNYPSGIISSLIGIAKVNGRKGDNAMGERLLRQALSKAYEASNPRIFLEVYESMAEFYRNSGNFQKAADSYQNYISVSDSLFSVVQFQTMKEIKNRFQITERMNRIREDLMEEERTQLYSFGFIFLLLAIAVILILLYRTKVILSAKLHKSNQTKDKLFSVISHDLINPFNVLIGSADLLQLELEEGNYAEAEKDIKTIQETLTETHKLISNLLYWARFQQDSIVVFPEMFDLSQLIEDVKSLSRIQADAKDISIELFSTKPFMVKADKNLIQIVLVNLVGNAIKFTPENGTITISAILQNNKVKVSVKDTGIGISEGKVFKLFQSAHLESTPGTKSEKGTGLGLLLCKEFIEKQNGEIGVKSIKGKGSVFYFTLPLGKSL